MQRLNVLLSAYACRPGEGSEPGIGWDIAQELAKYHDVWVITRENNRPSIEAELIKNPVSGLRFIYCDLPLWARWWRRGNSGVGVQIHYYLWQIVAYFVSHDLHRRYHFNLVHHVTYVKYWGPSFLSLLPVPFIWGPVGGGESAPAEFLQDFSWRGRLYETARNIARWLGEQDPFVHITAQRSILARATTEDTAQRLHALGAKTVQVYSQLGLSQSQIDELASLAGQDNFPVRFISIGRLLHWKGFHLGLQAFAKAALPKSSDYWIVGDGPERQRLETLVKDLDIQAQVKFLGMLPRQETLKCLGNCLALVHPSLHESGGLVCLEALAAGCPVLCLDLGGPAIQITENTGFKILASRPEQAVADLATAMTTLAEDQELRLRMGQAGQQHVREHYSWTVRGQELAQLYREVLDESKYLSARDSAPS
ncbi:MAG: glycosyltransferase family 4 protein [Acaryochloris sp. RU_4_1]|nr:glycosyltransferase family 4 protein [Acaryochloris sp. RU_4_1]NJR53501.1 glycosyltransferase family 4 protein [Acaryochloris sp. CRU_2_0]